MLRYKSDILSMTTVWIINLLPVEKNSMPKDKLSKTWMSFRYLTKVLNQNFKTTVLFSSSTPITCRQCSGVVVCCWYLVRRWLLTKSDFQSIFISSLIQFRTVFFSQRKVIKCLKIAWYFNWIRPLFVLNEAKLLVSCHDSFFHFLCLLKKKHLSIMHTHKGHRTQNTR